MQKDIHKLFKEFYENIDVDLKKGTVVFCITHSKEGTNVIVESYCKFDTISGAIFNIEHYLNEFKQDVIKDMKIKSEQNDNFIKFKDLIETLKEKMDED